MSTEDLARDLLQIVCVAVEIMSVGVEVPDPSCGLRTLCERSVEVPGLAERFEGRRLVDLLDLALRVGPTLWWADGHRVVSRGTGSEMEDHPFVGVGFAWPQL